MATADYLVIGGGAGGGSKGGGGGGAGGYQYLTAQTITAGTYTVTVGLGGAGGAPFGFAGVAGGNSVFNGTTANGGGTGGAGGTTGGTGIGGNGGSGGGGGGYQGGVTNTGGTGSQGNGGGTGNGSPSEYGGAGGGGSGGAGTNGTSGAKGTGGAGTSNSITGSAVTYAAGGDGGSANQAGTTGTANRGNGGGGNSNASGASGFAGGDGVVIVKLTTADWGTITGGSQTTSGGFTICTFNSSGSLVLTAAGGPRYWVGGSATWDGTAGSKWATTSGGTGGAAVPTSADDVHFDANSGASTVDWSTGNCLSLNFTGFTGTFSISGTTTIVTNLTLGSGMTFTSGSNSAQTNFTSTNSGNTITTNGISYGARMFFNGIGGVWTLQDNLTISSANTAGNLAIRSGKLDANNKNVTATAFIVSVASSALLTMGSGTWTITGGSRTTASTVWDMTGVTVTPNTSTITLNISNNNSYIFTGGATTYNNISITGSSTGDITITDSNTFNSFSGNRSVAYNLLFTTGTTTTVTTFSVSGTAGNLTTINSTTTGTHALVKSGGGTVSCDYLNIQHSVATPGTLTWYAGANSTNNQATATAGSGWIFTAPPGGVNAGFFNFFRR